MSIITREKLADLLESKKLIIDPILDIKKQVGELSIDLRLGIDFLITSYTRNPYIDVDFDEKRIDNHFKKTRRQIGDQIILYPHQTVLASTLEYVKLPSNVFCELKTRSSYNRLGLSVSTIIQPGYTGCFSLELTNNNHRVSGRSSYFSYSRYGIRLPPFCEEIPLSSKTSCVNGG